MEPKNNYNFFKESDPIKRVKPARINSIEKKTKNITKFILKNISNDEIKK